MRVDDEFVRQYDRLVKRIARQWARRVADSPAAFADLLDDLTASGYLGLLRAAETFDPSRPVGSSSPPTPPRTSKGRFVTRCGMTGCVWRPPASARRARRPPSCRSMRSLPTSQTEATWQPKCSIVWASASNWGER